MSQPPTFADRLLPFLTDFPPAPPLPVGVEAMNPYAASPARELLSAFAQRFYADNQPRVALLGINPGRFGGGTTGVAFTDPTALRTHCGIAHGLPGRVEVSSQFVYKMVENLGGAESFYQHFYLGSLYPLVLLRSGLNYNYYDAPALTQALWPHIRQAMEQQVALGLRRDVAVSLGRRNGDYLSRLNKELELFDRVVVLDHPRYLMQYKRREVPEFAARYAGVLGELL